MDSRAERLQKCPICGAELQYKCTWVFECGSADVPETGFQQSSECKDNQIAQQARRIKELEKGIDNYLVSKFDRNLDALRYARAVPDDQGVWDEEASKLAALKEKP